MKKILSLLILISMFSHLLGGTISCPSFNYICCISDSFDTCKCINLGVEEKCQTTVKCNLPSKRPIYIQDGKKIKATCN